MHLSEMPAFGIPEPGARRQGCLRISHKPFTGSVRVVFEAWLPLGNSHNINWRVSVHEKDYLSIAIYQELGRRARLPVKGFAIRYMGDTAC